MSYLSVMSCEGNGEKVGSGWKKVGYTYGVVIACLLAYCFFEIGLVEIGVD